MPYPWEQWLTEFTADQQVILAELALADRDRAAAFGLTPENIHDRLQAQFDLWQAMAVEFTDLCQRLNLMPAPIGLLWTLWLPLAHQIAHWKQQQSRSLIQGFLGGQGIGKTTLSQILTLALKHLGYSAVSWSLDDLYLTYAERQVLQATDDRLNRRGPPGTHDLSLGATILDQMHHGHFPLKLPRFDKSAHAGAGDRCPQAETIPHTDILLFEGWFVGVRPIDPAQFIHPPDPIVTDADRQFALDMNDRLSDYLPLWAHLDRLIVLQPSDYRLSLTWRQQAEQQRIDQGGSGMSAAEIEQFVTYFWRSLHPELFMPPLLQNPALVDLVVEINPDHQPGRVYQPLRSVGEVVRMTSNVPADETNLFEVETPLGFLVRTTASHWQLITQIKHPVMKGREADVQATLAQPDEVRLSKSDSKVYLFYRADGKKRWVCAVSKQLNGEGFLITTYRTAAIKEGIVLWQK